jgi:SAM-dependent methyltransferase
MLQFNPMRIILRLMGLMNQLRKIVNVKFRYMQQSFAGRKFTLLDVGAGNRSASKTKSVFPDIIYHGLDLDRSTNYAAEDFEQMTAFYEIDLTKLDYSPVPDQHFDYINMAHVIEHLHNGDQVLPLLLKKLKPGGFMYIEYPGERSTRLPSMHGTLNFKDDSTHVRVYSVAELRQIFEQNGCQVLSSGTRRNWYYILAMPLRILFGFLRNGKLQGNHFWDLLGFAEYLYVKKIPA